MIIELLSRKKKKNWIGTISGTLSHYSGIFFKSGTNELNESGWWKLLDKDPPEILIAKCNVKKLYICNLFNCVVICVIIRTINNLIISISF